MNDQHKKRKWVPRLLIGLLALLCVGAVELFACSLFAPELYAQVTAPVRRVLASAAELGGRAADSLSSFVEEAFQREEPPPDSQLASEPAMPLPASAAAYVATELTERDGSDVLTGGTIDVVYYNQGDELWAEQPYGSDRIGGYGCGPTAMAMAVSSMTDQLATPVDMAQWAVEKGYWAPGCGSYLSLVKGAAAAYGLTVRPFAERTPEALRMELATGNILVALMRPGHFTQSGHFILLRGVTLGGDILVADSNSVERSLSLWDPQLILDELSGSTDSGAPLWSLSPG